MRPHTTVLTSDILEMIGTYCGTDYILFQGTSLRTWLEFPQNEDGHLGPIVVVTECIYASGICDIYEEWLDKDNWTPHARYPVFEKFQKFKEFQMMWYLSQKGTLRGYDMKFNYGYDMQCTICRLCQRAQICSLEANNNYHLDAAAVDWDSEMRPWYRDMPYFARMVTDFIKMRTTDKKLKESLLNDEIVYHGFDEASVVLN